MKGLPKRIRYLANYILFLRDEDNVDESTDTSALFDAVNFRVSGLTDAEARARLQEDAISLAGCATSIPEVAFVQPFYERPDELLQLVRKPDRKALKRSPRRARPRYVLRMEMPAGFITRREGRALFAHREASSIIVNPATESEHRSILKLASREDRSGASSEISVEEVSLGSTTGHRIRNGSETRSLLLCVHGHHVTINLEGVAERDLLPCIKTLAYAKEI